MSEFFAHSARSGFPAQSYRDHICHVRELAAGFAKAAEPYNKGSREFFYNTVKLAAELHDLGKLDEENQRVLSGEGAQNSKLPVNHVDAGSAALLQVNNENAALAVYSHHAGLPDLPGEYVREEDFFRCKGRTEKKRTDASLPALLAQHTQAVGAPQAFEDCTYRGDYGVLCRMMLSCLADADHTDTAAAYGRAQPSMPAPELRAEERLDALDRYIKQMDSSGERNQLRQKMYDACRNAENDEDFTMCDSPVGSGKTTAVMAHLLRQAQKRGLRRIFVVLPYTTIIRQAVEVYRKALVLPGEDAASVVAELHSRVEFENNEIRHLSSLWQAPIIVTTAVGFFETLASNQPAALRKLHELPGSAVFIDEAHNALPIKLLPLAWKWMNTLSREWSCYWVLASGSPVRFWNLKKLKELGETFAQPVVTELVEDDLKKELFHYEENRVEFCYQEEALNRTKLIEWVMNKPGPRLLIVNTVQTAAVLANEIATSEKFGRACVEHLSTALTPEDRERTIGRIQTRLSNLSDTNWVLVATSCVEAGVDFSFRTGFREVASLVSLVQAAGRINRNGQETHAEMWSFTLCDDSRLKKNPALVTSGEILRRYFKEERNISPALCTESIQAELVYDNQTCLETIKRLLKSEKNGEFKTIEEDFAVIDSKTVTALVDSKLAEQVISGEISWQELQRKTVSIRTSLIQEYKKRRIELVKELKDKTRLYQWSLPYDDFLGYMRGILDLLS